MKLNFDALGTGDILGLGFGISSMLTGFIGDQSKANTQRYLAKSKALNYELQRDLSQINKRMLERQAEHIGRAYNKQIAIRTMKAGQAMSKSKASFAARGIQLGVGSTANVFASAEILKEIDRLTMNTNKVKAMNATRAQAINADIRSKMYGTSADNLFTTASSISPFLNMSTTFLTGASSIVSGLPSAFWGDE
tara:strand:+ start:147 stop:728 length:582 start_codon:yes stop_codon:yes gene_type:complete